MITKKTEYAIKALWELAQNTDNLTTSKEIAQRQAIPPKYLPQIIAALSQAGLLTSTRGYGGGLKLSRSAEEITLLQVIELSRGDRICSNASKVIPIVFTSRNASLNRCTTRPRTLWKTCSAKRG